MDSITFQLAKYGNETEAIVLFNTVMRDKMNFFTDIYPYDENQLQTFIGDNMINEVTIFAYSDQKMIGWVTVVRKFLKYQFHVGTLLIGILSEYRSKGIGTSLLNYEEELLPKIKIEKIEAIVREKSVIAINFFQKMGYLIEGNINKSLKLNPFEYDNEIILGKYL